MTIAELGVNYPADGSIPAQVAEMIKSYWLRAVLLPDVDLTPWIHDAHGRGLKVLGLMARESFTQAAPDGAKWTYQQWLESIQNADGSPASTGEDLPYLATCQYYAGLYGNLIDAIQAGNESDHASPSSWTLTPDELNQLLAATNQAFGPDMTIVGPGLVSGNPAYLDSVDLDLLDAIAVHPYGQRPDGVGDWSELPGNFGSVGALLDSYRRFSKPIWITEVGVSTEECSGTFQGRYCEAMLKSLQLRADVPVVTWFCMNDSMVNGFGLFAKDGSAKPAAAAFLSVAGKKDDQLPAPNYTVGEGVLAKMHEDGTTPGSDEAYYPVGVKPSQWSETMGKNGTIYRYLFATNETYRFPPSR